MKNIKVSPSITNKRTIPTKRKLMVKKGDQSESDDDMTKSPSVTAASNPTKKDSKRKLFNEKP